MSDLNEEFIKSLYPDELKKKIIELLSDPNLTDEERVEKLVMFMVEKDIE